MGLFHRFWDSVKYSFNIGGYRDLQEDLKSINWLKRREEQRLDQDQWLKEVREEKQAEIEKFLQDYLENNPRDFYGYKPLEI
ncbi:hypothetical protein Tfer_0039 [Thermincola ferriacetica]|uniref:Uncharacterized protein n=2 Tax=Thermincola ferriacetica TaxID=281456 RepID=A0A0L6W628_9FIRM|nr:hypothetical protein Tfer_0039 [Thermincola ferriacetica]